LAIIYAKTKQADAEIKILERYAAQRKAPGAAPLKLAARLAKLQRAAVSDRQSAGVDARNGKT
jgi:hypothetical protein